MLHCECGFEARAGDADGPIGEVQRHASEAHRMALSHDEALLLAFHAELNETGLPTIRGETTATQTRRRT